MKEIIRILHEGNYSCVIRNGEEIRTFTQRGVADLYDLLKKDASFLKQAFVADKVVGKAAAGLMVLGEVKKVYTDVISLPALKIFEGTGVEVSYRHTVPFIENRNKTGWCPLESSCYELQTVEEVFTVVSGFVAKIRSTTPQL